MTDHLQSPIQVAGHLYEKGGKYHLMLSWNDAEGKRQRKSQTTGLAVKGNKKRAETILFTARMSLEQTLQEKQEDKVKNPTKDELLFADFMVNWLEVIRKSVKKTTFGGYQYNVQTRIAPYFRKRGILLKDLTADDINEFYDEMLVSTKATTVLKFHANIRKALRGAKMLNIMEDVDRPKPEAFRGKFLKQSEVVPVFEAAQGHRLELGIILGAFYGLRRAEIVGLRWDAIDFDANSISIEHTVTVAHIDGKTVVIAEDTTKTEASYRSLPLIPAFRAKLLAVKEQQEQYRKLCGNSYNKKDAGYIYTDPLGNRIKPNYLSVQFPLWMVKNGFKRMRFHDLRHSCASLLLANGVPLKHIQEWLGHSDFAITANTYAHLEFQSKVASAQAMSWIDQTSLGASLARENGL